MKRRNDSLTAIGWALPMAMLAMGFAPARADDASELRANQELQSRLDQLAQMPPAGAPAGPAPVLSGSFPRSFVLPGTDTSVRIGGFGNGRITWYLRGTQPSNLLFVGGGPDPDRQEGSGGTGNLPSIPLNTGTVAHARSEAFYITGKSTRLFVDARTPTAWGVAQGYLELDFNNSNNLQQGGGLYGVVPNYTPRLRQAYAAFGPFLLGHTQGLFTDNDSDIELIDDGGQVGSTGRSRDGQLRYTWQSPWPGVSFAAAAEMPDSEFTGPNGTFAPDTAFVATGVCPTATLTAANAIGTACLSNAGVFDAAESREPALVFRGRIEQPWGHMQFGLVLRDATLNDGKFIDKTWMGYGGAISGDVKPFPWWPKDYIGYSFSIGEGLGGYIPNTQAVATNFGGTLGGQNPLLVGGMTGGNAFTGTSAAANAARTAYDSQVYGKTVGAFGFKLGYQHWWTPELRSNVDFSGMHQDVPNLVGFTASTKGTVNKELVMSHINLMWSPVSFVTTGVEYAWGHRVTVTNAKGDSHVIQGLLRVTF